MVLQDPKISVVFPNKVSILVLMEVSFRHNLREFIDEPIISFNPCFNGSIFQTSINQFYKAIKRVSILVLMEVSFRLCKTFAPQSISFVSILVLMEVSFRHGFMILILSELFGFNPCFNGSIFQTPISTLPSAKELCFNPCFNGSIFQTLCRHYGITPFALFQSLF